MKATAAKIRARVEDILRIILDGREPWDIRQYVSDQEAAGAAPWTIPEGGKPLSERQLRRYCDKAEALIAEVVRTNRKNLLQWHLAQRRRLFRMAVAADDLRAALAVLDSEAKLAGLWDFEVREAIDSLRREMLARAGKGHAILDATSPDATPGPDEERPGNDPPGGALPAWP
jgi:hypothetical protein